MTKEEMVKNLTQKAIQIRDELVALEQQFNTKKEEFLKVQGALEALSNLENEEKE
jgi:hypothetical protein